MASLVSFSWTCLRGIRTRLNALARTLVILVHQDTRVVDLERGTANEAKQTDLSREPITNVFSSDIPATICRKISAISRTILCLTMAQKTCETDLERGNPDVEVIHQPINSSTCTSAPGPRSTQSSKNMEDNATSKSSDANPSNISPSQSLSISSILDLMPIPVTMPEERALAASILAARNDRPSPPASPSPPPTPLLMTPTTTDSAHNSSFSVEFEASSVLHTPSIFQAPMMIPSSQLSTSTPHLKQRTAHRDAPPCELSVLDDGEDRGPYDIQEEREPWTGNAGFTFPIKPVKPWKKKRNLTDFSPSCPTVEEDEYEEEAMGPIAEPRLYRKNICGREQTKTIPAGARFAISDSPWDDGCNENYGLKGRAFWRQTMRAVKNSDPMEDQFWFNPGSQTVIN